MISLVSLSDGVEWNLRIDRERDRDGHARVAEAFEHWWQWARPLDQAFLDGYRDRPAPYLAEPAELPDEPLESPPRGWGPKGCGCRRSTRARPVPIGSGRCASWRRGQLARRGALMYNRYLADPTTSHGLDARNANSGSEIRPSPEATP